MLIKTAVIPVAGAGTRVLPMTSAIEKSMMPVMAGADTRPVIDYMVEDCAGAGLKRIVFVTTERGKQQISDYYSPELPLTLKRYLERLGKHEVIEAEEQRRNRHALTFEYIIQPPQLYGTTVPPFLARELLAGEKQFALMGGDDFVYHPDGTSELGLAIIAWQQAGTDHAIMGLPVPAADAGHYGVLQTNEYGRFVAIDEKPPQERIPAAPVVNISRYIFSDRIWNQLAEEMQTERGTAEHYITYPIARAVQARQTFHVHTVQGTYLDGGTFDGLEAAGRYVRQHPRRP